MRQLLNLKLWIAIGILGVLLVLITAVGCDDCFGSSDVVVASEVEKNIELVAIVAELSLDQGWQVVNGRTIGDATAKLDDGRIISIFTDTPAEIECGAIAIRANCVLLANMFGDSVMWFALTEINGEKPTRVLEMPSLVDMLDAGQRGVLANGWIVRLANGTKRTCGEATGTLREFINNYSPDESISKMNLITDQVDEVVCVN